MTVAEFDASVVKAAEATLARVAAAREAIGAVIFGQEQVVEQALVTLLAGGHGLLIGVPGLAKTKLVETLGIVMGLDALRVQFTPDLMPSDILGAEVMEEGLDRSRSFRLVRKLHPTRLVLESGLSLRDRYVGHGAIERRGVAFNPIDIYVT